MRKIMNCLAAKLYTAAAIIEAKHPGKTKEAEECGEAAEDEDDVGEDISIFEYEERCREMGFEP